MAGPLEDGRTAYVNGDYAEALRLLRPPAEQGDASAQFQLCASLSRRLIYSANLLLVSAKRSPGDVQAAASRSAGARKRGAPREAGRWQQLGLAAALEKWVGRFAAPQFASRGSRAVANAFCAAA